MLAILGNHLHIVQLLLYTFKDDLDSNVKNDEGFNPLDLAIVRKHSNIANTLLRDRYANPRITSLVLAVETGQAKSRYILQDPVSNEERHRNNIIYDIQGNRNPFIDNPQFVNSIF